MITIVVIIFALIYSAIAISWYKQKRDDSRAALLRVFLCEFNLIFILICWQEYAAYTVAFNDSQFLSYILNNDFLLDILIYIGVNAGVLLYLKDHRGKKKGEGDEVNNEKSLG